MYWFFLLLILLSGYQFSLVGVVYIGDIAAILGCAATLCSPKFRLWVQSHLVVFGLGLLAFLMTIALDAVNHIPRDDLLRGIARNSIFCMSIVAGCGAMVICGFRRWQYLVMGLLLAGGGWAILSSFYDMTSLPTFVKFGAGVGLAGWIPSYLAASRFGAAIGGLTAVAMAGFFWWADARGFMLMSGGVGLGAVIFPVHRGSGLFRVTVACGAAVGIALLTLNQLSEEGLGRASTLERQDLSSSVRTDMAWEAWRGFMNHPLTGNGTWQHARMYTDITKVHTEIIGVHSVALQWAFEYGLLGIACAGGFAYVLIKGVLVLIAEPREALRGRDRITLWWVLVLLAYNFCFSPFAGDSRFLYGLIFSGALIYSFGELDRFIDRPAPLEPHPLMGRPHQGRPSYRSRSR